MASTESVSLWSTQKLPAIISIYRSHAIWCISQRHWHARVKISAPSCKPLGAFNHSWKLHGAVVLSGIITICSILLVPAALVLTDCLLINHTDSMRKRWSVFTVSNITYICESVLTDRYRLLPPPGLQRSPPLKTQNHSQSRSVQSIPVQPLNTEWLHPDTLSLVRQRGNVVECWIFGSFSDTLLAWHFVSGLTQPDQICLPYISVAPHSLVPGLSLLKLQSCVATSAFIIACWGKTALYKWVIGQ